MKDNAVLDLEAVTKIYGSGHTAVKAVDDVSLAVKKGEVILIMGPSGSGKTTLLSLAGCLLSPTEGEVKVKEAEVTKLSENKLPRVRLKNFGFIFQAFNLLSALTALENVEVALNLAGVRGKKAKEQATKLLKDLGLEKRLHHRPENLSGGEKQRVAIARALANDPDVILADEPTANLDSKTGHYVMELLHKIAKEKKKSVVIVSHDMRIMDIADRVLQLEDGKLDLGGIFLATDPVCGMEIPKTKAVAEATYQGKTYYFCSKTCQEKFKENPAIFLSEPKM